MRDRAQGRLAIWLAEKCGQQHLSLRGASVKTGISHATISEIIKGNRPAPETIHKLADAFGGDGINEKLALEDHLLVLAGYRRPRSDENELSQPLAQVMDIASDFSESQLKVLNAFVNYLAEVAGNESDNR